jgi:DNA helicase HerA-like ATPase
MASRLAGASPGHVGDADTTGTVKSSARKVMLASLKGPVRTPLSGIVNGPIVQESPNKPVLPLTVASKVTANPFVDDWQANPPLIVPA